MNNLILSILLTLSLGFSQGSLASGYEQSLASDSLTLLRPKPEYPAETRTIVDLLEVYHYSKLKLTDSLSSVIFDNYFESLDPNKSYFLKGDIEYFEKYRFDLDNAIRIGDVDFAYQVFSIYRERVLSRIDQIYGVLPVEPDFTQEEYLETDRDKMEWSTTYVDQANNWKKIIKNQAMSYKLNGKEWNEIADLLKKRYERLEKAIYQYNSEDVYQAYMNALTSAYDPHTDYFSPISKENFQIDMSLSLEGIGAQLTQQLDYTKVADIIAGGPAYKSNKLQKDDLIIGVAQGDKEEFVDVIGWRLDEVVQKIRGPKGTVVRLQVIKGNQDINSLPDTIRLVRDKIKLERAAAKAEVIPLKEGNRTYNLGVVNIPSFYSDFEGRSKGLKDYKSTTRDVTRLVDSLKQIGIDGLMVDLRYNGGGSLEEVVNLMGLFIPKGPVVIQKGSNNSIDVLRDMDQGEVLYDGPLAVLTNRYSASASEIFSAAVQDYRRGVILGENTFGKGTVQSLVDLRRYVVPVLMKSGQSELAASIGSEEKQVGQLKLTLAKFYRVTGKSTQRLGVAPDVAFPSPYDGEVFGESSRPNALPWDEIASSNFQPSNQISDRLIAHLKQLYDQHLQSDEELKDFNQEVEKVKSLRDETKVSLNLNERKAELKDDEVDDDLSTTLDTSELKEAEDVNKKLSEDPYLKEGLRLLAELSKSKVG